MGGAGGRVRAPGRDGAEVPRADVRTQDRGDEVLLSPTPAPSDRGEGVASRSRRASSRTSHPDIAACPWSIGRI
jgi:hypothetical protein